MPPVNTTLLMLAVVYDVDWPLSTTVKCVASWKVTLTLSVPLEPLIFSVLLVLLCCEATLVTLSVTVLELVAPLPVSLEVTFRATDPAALGAANTSPLARH